MSGEMRLIYKDELVELREENNLLRKELEDERKAYHNRIVNYEAVLRELGEERERNRWINWRPLPELPEVTK